MEKLMLAINTLVMFGLSVAWRRTFGWDLVIKIIFSIAFLGNLFLVLQQAGYIVKI